MNELLTHLPLLRPRNKEAKAEYLNILPKILTHSIEHGIHIEESRQLLSFCLIHPGISGDERAQFTLWLTRLEENFAYSISQAKFSRENVQEISQCMQFMDHEGPVPPVGFPLTQVNGWDRSGSRDSGIAGNGSDSGSLLSLNNFGAKMNGQSGHTPLHSTLSAPPGLPSLATSSQSKYIKQKSLVRSLKIRGALY